MYEGFCGRFGSLAGGTRKGAPHESRDRATRALTELGGMRSERRLPWRMLGQQRAGRKVLGMWDFALSICDCADLLECLLFECGVVTPDMGEYGVAVGDVIRRRELLELCTSRAEEPHGSVGGLISWPIEIKSSRRLTKGGIRREIGEGKCGLR